MLVHWIDVWFHLTSTIWCLNVASQQWSHQSAEFGCLYEILCVFMTVVTVPRTQLVTPSSRSMAIIVCTMRVFQARRAKSDSLIWRDGLLQRETYSRKAAKILGPSDTHMKSSTRTCPSSELFIICMAETQQASVTQGCRDKPKLQTQTSPKTFIGESLECSSASGYSITPAEGEVICVHGLVTGSNVCNHSVRAASPTLVLWFGSSAWCFSLAV